MAIVKGQTVNDFQTAYQIGKLLGITQYQVNKWVDDFGGPGGIRVIKDGRGRKIHIEDIITLMDNGGEWPGEIDDSESENYESTPEEDGITHEYRIFVNGRFMEKWSNEPTRDDLINNYGSGIFRVAKIDRRNGMVESSQVFDCMNAPTPLNANPQTNVDSTLETIKKLRSIDGSNGGNDLAMVEMMRMNTTMMMGMLQQSNNMVIALINKNSNGGIKEILETMKLIKENELFDGGGGGDGDDATSELMKAGVAALPGLVSAAIEKLTGKSSGITDVDLANLELPEVRKLIPAGAPTPASQAPAGITEVVTTPM